MCSARGLASSGVMSLKTMPGFGKSGTSRMRARQNSKLDMGLATEGSICAGARRAGFFFAAAVFFVFFGGIGQAFALETAAAIAVEASTFARSVRSSKSGVIEATPSS